MLSSIRFVEGAREIKDESGFKKIEDQFSESIPVDLLSATRADETLANVAGYSADLVIQIAACNYAGQKRLKEESDGKLYTVKRAYQEKNTDRVLLTCEMSSQYGKV